MNFHRRLRPLVLVLGCAFLVLVALPAGAAGAQRCTLLGSAHADQLKGTAHRDVICGGGGADTIRGLAGNDQLRGGPGSDVLFGGKGRDALLGGLGADRLIGGPGADWFRGGPGADSCADYSPVDLGLCTSPRRLFLDAVVPPAPQPPQICGVATRPPDECPPDLYGIGVSPWSGDIAEGPVEVELTLYAHDEGGIAAAAARLRGPGGFAETIGLDPKNALEYEFTGTIVLGEASLPGSYWIDWVRLTDKAGNALELDEAALAPGGAYGWGHELQLYEGPDTEPPTLESLDISPLSVDTSGGPATVTMTVHATDPLAGVERIGGGFQMPNQPANSTYGFAMSRVQGRAPDGVWRIEINLPQHAAPGEWRLEDLHLTDNAGNTTHYWNRTDLEALPFPLDFTQTGPGDTTPPQILDLSIEETEAFGRPLLHFDVHLADDLAGIQVDNCLSLQARSLAEPAYSFGVTSPIQTSGGPLDGVLRLSTVFPDGAPTGAYEVESIEACDLTWNLAKLEDSALEAKGWDLSFANPG